MTIDFQSILNGANSPDAQLSALQGVIDSVNEHIERWRLNVASLQSEIKQGLEKVELMKKEQTKIMLENGVLNTTVDGLLYYITQTSQIVRIDDESVIPQEYATFKITPNKTAIKQAIKSGITVPGASLNDGHQTVAVRLSK